MTFGQVWWPILWICALHSTHPSAHYTAVSTHTVNTHPEQWAAIYAAVPGEQLGDRFLAQGSNLRGIEGGESADYSLLPSSIPAGTETRTCDLRFISPTLYPLGQDCPPIIWHYYYYIYTYTHTHTHTHIYIYIYIYIYTYIYSI